MNQTIEVEEVTNEDRLRAGEAAQAPLPAAYEPPSGEMTPMTILDRAVAQGADVAVLEKLMELQERHDANLARKAFDAAMAAARAEIPVIKKNREVDFTSNKGRTNYQYEDLAEIARTIDPILGKHGLSYRFETESNGAISVTCVISHSAGHSASNTLTAPRDDSGNKNPIQGIGSTLTYLQRLTLKAGLGLAAAKDDDATAAGATVITEEEAKAFHKLCDDLDGDQAKLCSHVGADDVESMTPAQLKKATQTLNAWARNQRKAND